ncbi:MAG: hypothetical protein IBX57_07530, partial [Gammaproteobacteria bacterium]|nr:hypothetical protein [Gammaproteobacteria bacterium]
KGKNPWPAHPNTLSYIEAVFSDEVTAEDRASKEDRIDYLGKLNPVRQTAILGLGKGWALRRGYLTENAINTPWEILKKKFSKKNISIPSVSIMQAQTISNQTILSNIVTPTYRMKDVDELLTHIDKVHSVKGLPEIPVVKIRKKGTEHGYFDAAGEIGLRDTASEPQLTVAHEIGHYIDYFGFFGRGYSSVNSELFNDWRRAIKKSPEVKNLVNIIYGDLDNEAAELGLVYDKKHVKYLLEPEELWARSYAQWVASKNVGSEVAKQLEQRLERQNKAVLNYTRQWKPDNFKAIFDAIDDIFKTTGWLNE